MISIERKHVHAIHSARRASDLYPTVQAAIELEHSTIPPYLTALFSLKQGQNVEVAAIIESVVIEEMLHMTIACNLLNAIGGSPSIANPRFIPSYPGPLPMSVRGGLTVGLAKASRALVHDVFMAIEEPEQPINLPDGQPRAMGETPAAPSASATIGEFYAALRRKLVDLDDPPGSIFPDPPRRQVASTTWYPASQLFPISNMDDATRAIDVIVDQGEGTATSPFEDDGEPAHYYRFSEIVHGRRIAKIDSDPGWAYTGAPVGLDPAGVWDLVTDAKAADYPTGSRVRVLVDMVNASYSRLLASLHRAFNGEPQQLDMALSIMVEMRLTAQKLVATPVPGTTQYAAPTFEWVDGGSL